jgi:hypothetical protein
LARFFGLYCIVMALAMIIRKKGTVAAIGALVRDPPLLLSAELLALAADIAMIVGHNIGSGEALPFVITLTIRGAGLPLCRRLR